MREITCTKNYSESINFVDSNNVFVGFDILEACCENFGYFYTSDLGDEDKGARSFEVTPDHLELAPYVFDKAFHREFCDCDEDGGRIVFRLTAPERPDIYLNIYNYHNGYYSHGFEFMDGETVILKGSL